MNFSGFDFDESVKSSLSSLYTQNRIPHAVIIESTDNKKGEELAEFISMWAVCTAEEKPCGKCGQCIKAKAQAHPDIFYAYTEKKSQTYSIEQMRSIIKDASIRPNEAGSKIYIFRQADTRLAPIVQNAFLKLLEEPPQNTIFILLCENSKRLLPTILSRCTVLRIKSERRYDETAVENSKQIANGIVSPKEWNLLTALRCLSDKEHADETLALTKLILRDCVAVHTGTKPIFDEELATKLTHRVTRFMAMEMIDVTENARQKIPQNVNINLLTTWLCGEYRRILWQR